MILVVSFTFKDDKRKMLRGPKLNFSEERESERERKREREGEKSNQPVNAPGQLKKGYSHS